MKILAKKESTKRLANSSPKRGEENPRPRFPHRTRGTPISLRRATRATRRDTETLNDEFGARYYSWRFGRWLSADWSTVPVAVPYANLANPQTLNLYAMVADDPESFADLDGHEGNACGDYLTCLSGGPSHGGSEYLSDVMAASVASSRAGIPPLQVNDEENPYELSTGAGQAQQKKPGPPAKVIRTGKRVYRKPTKINGVKFEGTRYTYKVADAKGNIVRGPITVTENLTRTSQTQELPTPATWSTTNGQFPDYVGYAEPPGGFPRNFLNVVDQTFVVTQDGVSTLLSTMIQQTVSTDANGNVTGVAHTIVP